ncbi:MAG: ester cyclase [Chloroflexi bacterium]|nr:ester cyclase [Chloroflexota bacterium]
MSPEQAKAQVNRMLDEVINQNHPERIKDYFAPDYVERATAPGVPPTREGVIQTVTMLRAAFPDFRYTVDDTLCDGDLVASRVTGHGTMMGTLQGMPATGKHASWPELHVVRLNQDGKIVEHWGNVDQLGMMAQLGLAPAPGAAQ